MVKKTILMVQIFISCSTPDPQWFFGKVNGFKIMNEHLNDIVFMNDTLGLAFGSNWESEDVLYNKLNQNQNAIIYKTTDGGKNWTSSAFGHGVFTNCFLVNDTVYALKLNYSGERVDNVKSSQIYISADLGTSWREIFTFPYGIYKIYFTNSKVGVFYTYGYHENLNQYLFVTKNGGNTWDSILLKHNDIRYSICSPDNNFYFLTSDLDEVRSYNKLIKIDLTNNQESVENLPFRTNILSFDESNNFWFLGKERNEINLYFKGKNGQFNLKKTFSSSNQIFSEYLYLHSSIINVVISELNKGQVVFRFFRSENKGNTWKEETLPVNYKIDPVSFYGDNNVWMNIGGGRLQIRKNPSGVAP